MKRLVLSGAVVGLILCRQFTAFGEGDPKPRSLSRPACVQCGFRDDCRSCVSGGNASFCETLNCGACEESGDCAQVFITQEQAIRREPAEPLTLSSKVIKDIGLTHPRFAATLAEMGVYGITPGTRRVKWTPVPLTPSDVEAFLGKDAHRRFFKQFDKEARRLNRLIQNGELSDIVYAVSINANDDGSWSLQLKLTSDPSTATVDPPYSTLDLQVAGPQAALSTSDGQSKRNVTWQIH